MEMGDPDVVASRVELVDIAEVERLLAEGTEAFTPAELDYASARSDPARRLAARLAAKRAARSLLGPEVNERDVAIERAEPGPPSLRLAPAARRRMAELGAARALVSLTHERNHAAALVVLVRSA